MLRCPEVWAQAKSASPVHPTDASSLPFFAPRLFSSEQTGSSRGSDLVSASFPHPFPSLVSNARLVILPPW